MDAGRAPRHPAAEGARRSEALPAARPATAAVGFRRKVPGAAMKTLLLSTQSSGAVTRGRASDAIASVLNCLRSAGHRHRSEPRTPHLPLDTHFIDERGAPVRLGNFFGRRPVLLVARLLHAAPCCAARFSAGWSSGLRPLSTAARAAISTWSPSASIPRTRRRRSREARLLFRRYSRVSKRTAGTF